MLSSNSDLQRLSQPALCPVLGFSGSLQARCFHSSACACRLPPRTRTGAQQWRTWDQGCSGAGPHGGHPRKPVRTCQNSFLPPPRQRLSGQYADDRRSSSSMVLPYADEVASYVQTLGQACRSDQFSRMRIPIIGPVSGSDRAFPRRPRVRSGRGRRPGPRQRPSEAR
jgi:hypothetical protein